MRAKPDADNIVVICELFGVSADYLLRDRHSVGISDPNVPHHQTTALGDALRKLTLSQWLWGIALFVCLIIMLILKILSGFHPCYWNDLSGLQAFLRTYDLLWLWWVMIFIVAFSIGFLFGPPIIRWVMKNGCNDE